MTITVGPGLAGQLAANGDHPVADYRFDDQEDANGHTWKVERVLGTKGLYLSSNASGTWENVGPLPLAE